MRQNPLPLLICLNPLPERVGVEFFRTAPKLPGVYLMKSAAGDILYVGKAKNLRTRLNSYRRARPSDVSRKTLRLLRLTHAIEVRVCDTEADALLTENRLLRELSPPFNVLNTSPESYYFWVVEKRVDWPSASCVGVVPLRFRLTNEDVTRLEPKKASRAFGVFKGRRRARESFQALLRLLSALGAADETFRFPTLLTRYRAPREYTLLVPKDLSSQLNAFLNGRSAGFLATLTTRLLANEGIPRFVYHVITEDLKTLEEFYDYGPCRVRALRRRYRVRSPVIAQTEIDDLLALEQVRRRS